MTPLAWLLTFFGGQWLVNQIYNEWEKSVVTREAKKYARARNKPVLDFGCGLAPRGDYNVDILPRKAPNFVQIHSFAPPRLPFPTKFFGSALCFHALEHTNNPQHTVEELSRIAEKVFILTPSPLFWRTWLHGGHKWIFIGRDVYIKNPLYVEGDLRDVNALLYPEELKLK